MRYLKVHWKHDIPDEPRWLYSELDDQRLERRKIDVFPDSRWGFADEHEEVGGSALADSTTPAVEKINADPEFDATEIDRAEFESLWTTRRQAQIMTDFPLEAGAAPITWPATRVVWFTARTVTAEALEDLGTFIVCAAENTDGSGQRLELQRALAFDDEDRRLGIDTYCISTDAGATCFGGITNWAVTRDIWIIDFDARASAVLNASGYRVRVELSDEKAREILKGFQRVLGDPTGPELP